jgi:hypothetical protein
MAISKRTLDFLARIYTPIAFGLLIFFVYVALTGTYLDTQGRPFLAIGGGLFIAALFWMFYVRWFVAASQFTYPTWPPYLSSCPDYLTFMGTNSAGEMMCVDFVGVSRRNGLKKSDPLLPPRPEEKDYIFFTKTTDTQQKKCNAALGKGLSWAGITAGTGCA